MSKDVIRVHGDDVVVREDTAKAYRGVNWALISVAAFILITATLFIIFTFTGASDNDLTTPAGVEAERR
jgi:hypothetical protein